ncbi:hypothetical protein lerEdw1_020150 [Lerista edwardsae]|nr:hypothetical protein lerEdw1_020150 [Lerista edwardsae]
MTSQSQGIQQLLQAEKRAKDKLEEAKKNSSHILLPVDPDPPKGESAFLEAEVGNSGLVVMAMGKGKRLKQAKEEATAEIDHYRLHREKDFRHKQSNVMGSQGNLTAKIDEGTIAKIRDITNRYHKNMESVMGHLLDKVYDINPEFHPNYAYTTDTSY